MSYRLSSNSRSGRSTTARKTFTPDSEAKDSALVRGPPAPFSYPSQPDARKSCPPPATRRLETQASEAQTGPDGVHSTSSVGSLRAAGLDGKTRSFSSCRRRSFGGTKLDSNSTGPCSARCESEAAGDEESLKRSVN